MNKIKAYQEILEVLEKHDELVKRDPRCDIASTIRTKIRFQQISDEFKIEVDDRNSSEGYIRFSKDRYIRVHGTSSISWSDDGNQPQDEYLYCISFPTGAYIFGDNYPVETFNDFFAELKSYNPKYSDTMNHCLYFSSENANIIHEAFRGIYDKYNALVRGELERKKIAELEHQLKALKGESDE